MRLSRLPTNNSPHAWILVDEGQTFLENQALAIVEAMDLPTKLYRVTEEWFWHYIPIWLGPNPLSRIKSSPRPLRAPWPPFVICGGPIALRVGDYLKKKQNTYTVALGSAPSSFDKIIREGLDSSESGNLIITCGPLHRIHPEQFGEARVHFYRKIDHLPKPRIGLFLEGDENVEGLVNLLRSRYKKSPFSLMIYGKDLTEGNQQKLKETGIPQVLWVGEAPDPYLGFLAHSDGIIITNTSSLMMVEVSSIGKRLSVYLTQLLDNFTQTLINKGVATLFDESSGLVSKSEVPSLQEAQRVANILKGSIPK